MRVRVEYVISLRVSRVVEANSLRDAVTNHEEEGVANLVRINRGVSFEDYTMRLDGVSSAEPTPIL